MQTQRYVLCICTHSVSHKAVPSVAHMADFSLLNARYPTQLLKSILLYLLPSWLILLPIVKSQLPVVDFHVGETHSCWIGARAPQSLQLASTSGYVRATAKLEDRCLVPPAVPAAIEKLI